MPEKDSSPTPESAIEEKPGAESAATGSAVAETDEAAKASARPASRRKKRSRISGWFWFIVLLLILLGLSLGWEMTPLKVRMSVLQNVHDTFLSTRYGPDVLPGAPPRVEGMQPLKLGPNGRPLPESQPEPVSPAKQAPAPAAEPAASPSEAEPAKPEAASTPEAAAEPATEPVAPAKPAATTQAPAGNTAPAPAATAQEAAPAAPAEAVATQPSLTPDQAAALLDEMHRLQGELAAVQTSQSELRQQLQARDRLELRTRLRWLASPDSRLAQQAALWGEIAVMPYLDAAQHATAEAMTTQAQDDLRSLEGWRKALVQLAGKLPEKQGADILPKTGNKYLAWLADAFHLRQAQDSADKQRAGLRQRVMDMQRNLGAENWPDARDWRRLLGDLRDQFGEDTDLGLPESIQGVEQHLAAMRQKAADWLASL